MRFHLTPFAHINDAKRSNHAFPATVSRTRLQPIVCGNTNTCDRRCHEHLNLVSYLLFPLFYVVFHRIDHPNSTKHVIPYHSLFDFPPYYSVRYMLLP